MYKFNTDQQVDYSIQSGHVFVVRYMSSHTLSYMLLNTKNVTYAIVMFKVTVVTGERLHSSHQWKPSRAGTELVVCFNS